VKAICDILFQAKINSLDSLRRESISADDASSAQAQTDYTTRHSITNELAVMAPYDITFRCFSAELASALAGFASSPYSLLVKTINVEPAPATPEEATQVATSQMPMAAPQVIAAPPPPPGPSAAAERDAFNRRYGLGPEGSRRFPTPAPQVVPQPQVVPAPGTATSGRGGLPTVLDEKQLKVTISVDVVKLLPSK
jgi:hypothetical protein